MRRFTPARRRAAAAALVAGATQPSLPAILGALLLCAGLWATCALTLNEELVASGALISSPNDDYAALAAAALRGRYSSQSGGKDVVIIGSSATREALTSPQDLAAALAEEGARHLKVTLLTAGDLTPVEALAVVDILPVGLKGVAVLELSARTLGLSPRELAELLRERRLPLDSPSQVAALADLERASPTLARGRLSAPDFVANNYFFKNYAFFLARPRALGALFGRHVKPELHQADKLPAPSPADWERLSARLLDWLLSVDDPPAGLRVLARLVDELKAHGLKVVLLDAPRNPALLEALSADPRVGEAQRRVDMAAGVLAQTRDVTRVNPTAAAGLTGEDFIDHCHVISLEGRRAFTASLAAELAPSLAGAASGGAP